MDFKKFENWLKDRGCEILPPTNEYEAVRFKGREVGVLYKSGKHSNMFTSKAVQAFKRNKKWDGKPINVGRKKSYRKQKQQLLIRDGSDCFLCGKPLGEDITLEHLIALSSGGKNTLGNMVLMHENCNNSVKNITIVEKVRLAIKNRTKNGDN